MTDKLPLNLLALFVPRPQLRYIPPQDHAPEERKTAPITGIAAFVPALREKAAKAQAVAQGAEIDEDDDSPEHPPTESTLEKRNNAAWKKQEHQHWLVTEGYKTLHKPREDPNIRGDALKTLFVGRLPYDVETRDLEDEFRRYGAIERVKIVLDNGKSAKAKGRVAKKHKPRGYAFIVFERENDTTAAYKGSETTYIRGRRVVVDVERGRTMTNWKPRRFGGGYGGRHYTKAVVRPQGYGGYGPPSGPGMRGSGLRGNFDRGGFRGGRGGGYGGRGGGGGYGGGGRGGIGYQSNGYAPDGAPRGPGRGGGGGYGGRGGGGGGGGYDDRGPRNANFEPLPPRGGYRDRDRDRDGDRGGGYGGHKRPYEGGGYDESRSRRRY